MSKQQSRNTAGSTEGCWAFRVIRAIPGLERSDNTTPQYSWINTQRTILTDKHSARVGLAGWPEGGVGREEGVDMRVCERERSRGSYCLWFVL